MSILVLFWHGFWWLWDQFWRLLVAWRHAWNFMIFDGFPGGPGAEQPWPFDGIWVAFWSPFHQPNSFQELFNMQNTSWNMQEWRDTKKQDANYENTKNQSCNVSSLQRKIKAVTCSHNNRGTRRNIEQILRSLVARLRGAGGFCDEADLHSFRNNLTRIR